MSSTGWLQLWSGSWEPGSTSFVDMIIMIIRVLDHHDDQPELIILVVITCRRCSRPPGSISRWWLWPSWLQLPGFQKLPTTIIIWLINWYFLTIFISIIFGGVDQASCNFQDIKNHRHHHHDCCRRHHHHRHHHHHCCHHQNATSMNRKLCRKLVTGYFKVLQKQLSVQLGQTANGFALRRMEVICSKQ